MFIKYIWKYILGERLLHTDNWFLHTLSNKKSWVNEFFVKIEIFKCFAHDLEKLCVKNIKLCLCTPFFAKLWIIRFRHNNLVNCTECLEWKSGHQMRKKISKTTNEFCNIQFEVNICQKTNKIRVYQKGFDIHVHTFSLNFLAKIKVFQQWKWKFRLKRAFSKKGNLKLPFHIKNLLKKK